MLHGIKCVTGAKSVPVLKSVENAAQIGQETCEKTEAAVINYILGSIHTDADKSTLSSTFWILLLTVQWNFN